MTDADDADALADASPEAAAAASDDNADPAELARFSALAHRWWDPESEFKPLHQINPLRLEWIDRTAKLSGKTVLDVGCGGGILAEAMVQRGARVKGTDLSLKALKVARFHLHESGLSVDYEAVSAEALAAREPGRYDVITCMEMLEHVPDPASVVTACAVMAKPGAHVFFSTINRNPKAYLLAVIGAEYVLKLLPRGTHDYAKFIKPSELAHYCRRAGLDIIEIIGMTYNPFSKDFSLGRDTDVNYLAYARRPGDRTA
ncbi:MAG: bifunctional 2-polyprenyl-6-hydroxyphenol methylase/3-demethylubiquinol 3-O-methyltransferase UbiG [Betaproteobacteria bacterium]|nr:bifunctional 2-polyprenyl-6-hydroxyphenol methylase/3-demethylubiquinol 3-O-methyltransferase UbiG [Betaproteobacteria bacterium]